MCGRRMYAGTHNEKPAWRCTLRNCNVKRSVRAKNEFFFYKDSIGRLQHKLGLHKILEHMYLWLFTEQTVEQKASIQVQAEILLCNGGTIAQLRSLGRWNSNRKCLVRLAGDVDDEAILVLPDDDEGTGDEDTVDYIRFGEDHSSWKWVVAFIKVQLMYDLYVYRTERVRPCLL